MKNLKFRIWDKQFNKFLYQLPEKHHLDWERFDIQQFTGLSDKSGVEIYEGDIIHYGFYWDTENDRYYEKDNLGEIIYNAKCSEFCEKDGFNLADILQRGKNIEVIGNIYENKDLIK